MKRPVDEQPTMVMPRKSKTPSFKKYVDLLDMKVSPADVYVMRAVTLE